MATGIFHVSVSCTFAIARYEWAVIIRRPTGVPSIIPVVDFDMAQRIAALWLLPGHSVEIDTYQNVRSRIDPRRECAERAAEKQARINLLKVQADKLKFQNEDAA